MELLIYVTIILLLLLLIRTSIPVLHPLYIVIFFFLLLAKLIFEYFIPFIQQYTSLIDLPSSRHIRLLLFSALLFYLSDAIYRLMKDMGYDSIGMIIHTSIKIIILGFWMKEILSVIGILSKLLSEYS